MIDQVRIRVVGGSGGKGCVSFRREKFVPRGGPDGGDGGNGGSVIIVADGSVRTLREMGRKRVYKANPGRPGQGSDKHGRRGEDILVRVPEGTEVRDVDEDRLLGDLDEVGKTLVVARGGLGGRGNKWFARAVYRAPRIAQRGQDGEEREIQLDLKLLADVGVVGLPNAGKSTLLQAISAARPKVADYPFTTLEPALGVVDVGYERFVVADIPGLIEGAHEGAGLGLDFLRHVERTKVLVHMVDGSSPEPLADVDAVNRELSQYSEALANRPQLVVVNKIDLPDVEERIPELKVVFDGRGITPLFLSAAERQGTDELMRRLVERLAVKEEERPPEEIAIIRPQPLGRRYNVRREGRGFRVEGERVVTFAEMMPMGVEEGRQELWWRLGRWGVSGALRRAGARPGDRVRLGDLELEWPG
ncbi:MAG: GTPase ObgE [Chloroflexi bacterium]|nr:GTPase ObgE [Chloroflexota bacterium]